MSYEFNNNNNKTTNNNKEKHNMIKKYICSSVIKIKSNLPVLLHHRILKVLVSLFLLVI